MRSIAPTTAPTPMPALVSVVRVEVETVVEASGGASIAVSEGRVGAVGGVAVGEAVQDTRIISAKEEA